LDEEDWVDWLQTGIYRVSVEDGSITHHPTNITIDSVACFNGHSDNWTVEQNHSTKSAKLRNLDNDAIFPLISIFKEHGHVLKGRLKSTSISPRVKQSGGTAAETNTQSPPSTAAVPTDGPTEVALVQGRDGRYRLQASAAEDRASSPGLAAKSRAKPPEHHREQLQRESRAGRATAAVARRLRFEHITEHDPSENEAYQESGEEEEHQSRREIRDRRLEERTIAPSLQRRSAQASGRSLWHGTPGAPASPETPGRL
jgi:hypothetical protein